MQTLPETDVQTIITEIEREIEEAKKANQDNNIISGSSSSI
jgi:hypothetical protein